MKSRVTARPVRREAMPDKRRQREEGRKEGMEEEEERGVYSTRGKRQTVNIHKVSEGRMLNACGRKECV